MAEIESTISPDRDHVDVPVVGKVFNCEEEVRTYYREYAFHVGFGVSKISNRKRDGLQYFSLACSRYGNYVSSSSNPRPTTAVNCPAKINVKVSRDGQYEISKVQLEHNHDLSPNKSRRFRSHKKLDLHSRRSLELNDDLGLRLDKSFSTLVHEAGGHDNMTFNESEARTYIRKTRLELGVGDAEALQQYFCRMVSKNGDFYYNMDLDDEGRLRNVFWADGRCRAAFGSFSDAITFDSTYLTNKYDMSFAPFVGVNHHGQSILLGCALLSSESTTTYTWLFRTWLDCMGGVAPGGIVTDQCAAMREAIATVFPYTRHRLCLWHIMRKIPTKLSAYSKYKLIKKTMKTLVYEIYREVEFELGWQEMIEKFGLQGNDWLTSLYDIRTSWVSVYLKAHFWAGMSTTQRSESMNAFFDGYVTSKTSLKQFVVAYDNALRNKAEKENQADFMSFHKNIPLVTEFDVERQFAQVYTHDILRKFQAELKGLVYCNVREVHSGVREVHSDTYEVNDTSPGKDGRKKPKMFLVDITDRTMECECSLFNFKGIICRHIVAAMTYSGVDEVYHNYILPRWKKNITRRHTLIASSYDDDSQTLQMRKYDRPIQLARPGHEIAVTNLDPKAYEWWKEHIVTGVKKLLSWVSEVNCKATFDVGISDPVTRRRRGRPPTSRLNSNAEKFSRKKKKGKMTAAGESSSVVEEQSVLPTQTSLPTYLSQTSTIISGENTPQPPRMSLPEYDAPERFSYSEVFCQSKDTLVWNVGLTQGFPEYRDRIESEDSD